MVPEVTKAMEKFCPLLWTRLEVAIEARGEDARCRVYFHPAEAQIQQGPTCGMRLGMGSHSSEIVNVLGFVALILAARAAGLESEDSHQVDLTEIMAWARMLRFTKEGEMFSGLNIIVNSKLQ